MKVNHNAFMPNWTTPPGKTISRLMSKLGLSFDELATEIDVSNLTVQELIVGNVLIDEKIAEGLSNTLGSSIGFWLNRENQYREDLKRLNKTQYGVKVLDYNWVSLFPINEMRKFGWISPATTRDNYLETLLAFFGIKTAEEWNKKYQPSIAAAAFRTSPTFQSNPNAVIAWLRWAELKSLNINCNTWNREALITSICTMRKLTRQKDPAQFIPKLQELCAFCGIVLTIAPALNGCKASGATRFLTPKKAQIILSLRYKSDDYFWFTFFHEIGHLVLHSNNSLFLEDNSDVHSQEELEANQFSEDVLIPKEFRDAFYDVRPRPQDILRLSVKIGVSSGIVVGQLQQAQKLNRNQMNYLKRKYRWSDFA